MQLGKVLEHLKFKILIIIIYLINQYAGTHQRRPWIKILGSNSYFSIDFQNVYQVILTLLLGIETSTPYSILSKIYLGHTLVL